MGVDTDIHHRARVRYEVEHNDPPVEPGQFWICYRRDGVVNRRVRILAQLPVEFALGDYSKDGRVWLMQEHPAAMHIDNGRIITCPEFNLRYVFELE